MSGFSSKASYIGWIPCVNGHLDFGLMKEGIKGGFTKTKIKDRKSICVSYSPTGQNDRHTRNVAIQSWVDWQDSRSEDGEFRVCVIGSVSEEEDLESRKLIGSIIIYPKAYELASGCYQGALLDKFHALSQKYKAYKRDCSTDGWGVYQAQLNELWDGLKEGIPDSETVCPKGLVIGQNERAMPNIFRVDYEVLANGLSYVDFHNLQGQKVGELTLEDEDKFIICRQAFYYLKYSLHVHKHHEHKADALTSIVPNDEHSALKLIGQIKRELTAIKRTQLHNRRKHHSAEAVGIIGYLQSLLACLRHEKHLKKRQYELEKARLVGVEKSFQGQLAGIEDRYAKKVNIANSSKQFTAMALAFVSLSFLAFVNLFRQAEGANSSSLLDTLRVDELHFSAFPITLLASVMGIYYTIKLFYFIREEKIPFWRFFFKRSEGWLYVVMITPPSIALGAAYLLG